MGSAAMRKRGTLDGKGVAGERNGAAVAKRAEPRAVQKTAFGDGSRELFVRKIDSAAVTAIDTPFIDSV
jgi:hypothetical protein